jgi:hypothetical protein
VNQDAGDKNAGELPLANEPAPFAISARQFLHTYEFYAERFGVTDRSVKRWAAEGRAADPPDLPPLDCPRDMPAWWGRRMSHRVPARLLEVAATDAAEHAARHQEPAPGTVTPATSASVADRAVSSSVGMGETVTRLREAERDAGEAFATASKPLPRGKDEPLDAPLKYMDAGQVEMLQRRWERMAEALRKAVKDEAEMAETRGELLEKGKVARVLQEIHASVAESIRGLVRRVRPKLAGRSAEEQDEIWQAETEKTFSGFQHELAGS